MDDHALRAATDAEKPKRAEEQTQVQQERGCSIALIGCFGIAALAMVALTIAGVVLLNEPIRCALNLFQCVGGAINPTPVATVNVDIVVDRIRSEALLVSSVMESPLASVRVVVQQGFQGICGHAAEHTMTGRVSAGVDLQGFSRENVAITRDLVGNPTEIVITLPGVQITDCNIMNTDQYWGTLLTPFCQSNWGDLQQIAEYFGGEALLREAEERRLLDAAETSARRTIRNLIGGTSTVPVRVEFAQAQAGTLPATCDFNLPSAWLCDDQTMVCTPS